MQVKGQSVPKAMAEVSAVFLIEKLLASPCLVSGFLLYRNAFLCEVEACLVFEGILVGQEIILTAQVFQVVAEALAADEVLLLEHHGASVIPVCLVVQGLSDEITVIV